MKVELTPDAAQWVETELAAGRFATAEVRYATPSIGRRGRNFGKCSIPQRLKGEPIPLKTYAVTYASISIVESKHPKCCNWPDSFFEPRRAGTWPKSPNILKRKA
jgi:hypothetical protein